MGGKLINVIMALTTRQSCRHNADSNWEDENVTRWQG